ncbi:hypothetical protein [Asticcacaulis excentricus]|uniref:STAS/SEC14 domain-containing protein n=1 Tax=Asticcacaulis excentricus (strain ATCC 15261 / DSM 4724 / KCTC 12464 / NCIMB 9791 / VKM B-1370 / CB 48) TaxID=573065 RepID=E8RVZ0_ASTEC|nr:hypothetical protein [Asticcacaulis excentricus]ADU15412.1 hypothetical protein Astex_3802 [Asticcacaulis excentricus CB 48]
MADWVDIEMLNSFHVDVNKQKKIITFVYPLQNIKIDVPQIILSSFLQQVEPWTFDLLTDMSGFEGFVPWPQLEEMADIWSHSVGVKDAGRAVAIVSQQNLIHERLDGYQELWPNREFKIFHTVDEASEWLLNRRN